MSRIAKKVIKIADKVTVAIDGQKVSTKGPLGELSFGMDQRIKATQSEEGILFETRDESLEAMALWGTYASIFRSQMKGVTEGFVKKLIIDGIGYKADIKGSQLVMSLGFSHQVIMDIPDDLKVTMEKAIVVVSGIDKERVGSFAAQIRAKKKPEPYKGKGIRYEGEVIRRKQGKKSV